MVNRRASLLPMADDYSESLHVKRDVSVWCSNDYLGMSHHPKVTKAIMWVGKQCDPWKPWLVVSNKGSFNRVNSFHLFSCKWGCTTSWRWCRRHKKYFRDKQIPCGTWIWACWPAWQECSTAVHLLLCSQWFHIVYSGKNATRYIE